MKTVLKNAIKKEIEKEVIEAISEVDISYYLQPKRIKSWVEGAVRDHIARKVSETVEMKIFTEIRKVEPQLGIEIQRLVFEEVSKHIKL